MRSGLKTEIAASLAKMFIDSYGEMILVRAFVEDYTFKQAVGNFLTTMGISRANGSNSQEFINECAKLLQDMVERMNVKDVKKAGNAFVVPSAPPSE